jgi:hypothetical protein
MKLILAHLSLPFITHVCVDRLLNTTKHIQKMLAALLTVVLSLLT